MASADILFVAYAWLIRIALGLLIIAAITTAVKKRSLHSICLAIGGILIATGFILHYAAMSPFTVVDNENLVVEARFQEPLETVSKVCNVAGALSLAIGAVALTSAMLRVKSPHDKH